MIKIKLNKMEYRYQVYHIVELFFKYSELEFVEENSDYSIEIQEERLLCSDKCETCEFTFERELTYKENIKKAIFLYFTNKTKKFLPWGTLIGIRPTKKALTFLKENKSDEEIIQYLKKHFCTDERKARLCIDVAREEEKLVNTDSDTISIYVGMPFCTTRCLYCSFISDTIGSCKNIVQDYLDAMKEEIRAISQFIKEKGLKVECVYFGGGTPTSVNNMQFEDIMKCVYDNFVRDFNIQEFTVECGRPDTINREKLMTMKKYKVDRISINPQTMNDKTLKAIGRNHTKEDVIEKFNLARELDFDNINMDIILGLPGEDVADVQKTCGEILSLKPDNLTVHGMSIKRGSRLHEHIINNGKFKIPEQSEINKMYDKTDSLVKELKMKPYYMYRQKNMVGNMENVGYSSNGKHGLYNIEMIEERQTIVAIGAHAVSKVIFLCENRIERFPNVKDVREYIKRYKEMITKKIDLMETLYK